jgi:hypothetical protein
MVDRRKSVLAPVDEEATKQDADNYTGESHDEYLPAQSLLPQGGEMRKAKVTGRKRDADSLPLGRQNWNPLLDSRIHRQHYRSEYVFPGRR